MPKFIFADHDGSMRETLGDVAQVIQMWGAWLEGLGDAVREGVTQSARPVQSMLTVKTIVVVRTPCPDILLFRRVIWTPR